MTLALADDVVPADASTVVRFPATHLSLAPDTSGAAAVATVVVPDAPSDADIDELVSTHLPLVGYLVRELVGRLPAHIARDELVSAGRYALVVAARSFDAARGVPFARFATIRIRGALTDELRSMDWASRSVRGKARELHNVRAELTTGLGRTPTRDEVASAMGVAAAEVDAVDADVRRASVLSLQSLAPDCAESILPVVSDGPEGLLLKREQLGYLHDAVETLPERLRAVVRQYFFEQRTMLAIAADLGVTESRVSQLRSEALELLRAGLQAVDGEVDAAREAGRRAARRDEYCKQVASRSTLAQRLGATTVLGDAVAPAAPGRPLLRSV